MALTLQDILSQTLALREETTREILMDYQPHDVPTFQQEVDFNLNDIHYEIDEGYAKLPLDMTMIEYAVRWTLLNMGMPTDAHTVVEHMERYHKGI
jgi:hypothetical protein